MVDIGAAMQARRFPRRDTNSAWREAGMLVDVRPADDMALADYAAICRTGVIGPAQHPVWVRSWIMATGADTIIVTAHRNGRPAFSMALEVARKGPFRVARFVGDRHANGNFAAAARDNPVTLSADDGRTLAAAIRDARPDIDLVMLERQNPHREGVANPLSGLATVGSPNVSLAVDLAGGFDALLARMGGKRKRKKYRLQLRRYEELGGYRLIEAATPEEVERLISAFYVMKAARFAKKGIANVFGPQEVQTFFRLLFRDALDHSPAPFLLQGVEIEGEIYAVHGLSVTPASFVCEFGGIRDDNPHISPGYFLDYLAIEQAAGEGKEHYDFSVGDEVYKRSWCDVETWQFDTLLPLTAKGRILRNLELARAHAVRLVKSNEALWASVKRLRAKAHGEKPNADD